jgi:hypothetical protein
MSQRGSHACGSGAQAPQRYDVAALSFPRRYRVIEPVVGHLGLSRLERDCMTHSRDPVLAPLHRLMVFAQSVRVRRMIEGIALDPKQTFWIMTVNLLADAAAIEWCKVFGSREEDTHWTRVLPKGRHEQIREDLLNRMGLTEEKWKEYRDSIVSYRDQVVAHHDLEATVAKYPHYDVAIVAANFMFDQIRNVANPDWLGGIPTSLDTWSQTVAGNMSAIVKKAFEASSTLGSNVAGGGK